MPVFRYHAVDAAGQKSFGEIEAVSAAAARTRLEADGLRVQTLFESEAGPAGSRSDGVSGDRPITSGESQQLGQYIADLAAARLPLSTGLRAIARDCPQVRLRRRLERVVAQLETGDDLERVLESHDVPPGLRALVRAGLRSNSLESVLARYGTDTRNACDLRQRILAGLAYPLLVLLLAVMMFVGCLIWIVPQFEPIFFAFSPYGFRNTFELPFPTVWVLALSDVLRHSAVWIAFFVLAAAAAIWYAARRSRRNSEFGRWWGRLPVAGPLLRNAAVGRYAHLLALLLENEMPLPGALRLAGQSVTDVDLRQASEELAVNVESGEPLSAAAYASHFPSSFIEALNWQQHRGNVADTMRAVGEMFDNRVRNESHHVIVVFEPVVIVIAGSLLLCLVLPLILPLFEVFHFLL